MESLCNLDCPQFVDFTSFDAFNMLDGADGCFEKQIVGGGSAAAADQTLYFEAEINFQESTRVFKDTTNSGNNNNNNSLNLKAQTPKLALTSIVNVQQSVKVVSGDVNRNEIKPKPTPTLVKSNNKTLEKPSNATKSRIASSKNDENKPLTRSRKAASTAKENQSENKNVTIQQKPNLRSTAPKTQIVKTQKPTVNSSETQSDLKTVASESVPNNKTITRSTTSCFERLYNQRNKSVENRHHSNANPMPIYQGVRFIPKYTVTNHKAAVNKENNTTNVQPNISGKKEMAKQINAMLPPPPPPPAQPKSKLPVSNIPKPISSVQKVQKPAISNTTMIKRSVSNSTLSDRQKVLRSREEITSELTSKLETLKLRKQRQIELATAKPIENSKPPLAKSSAIPRGIPMNTERRALKRQQEFGSTASVHQQQQASRTLLIRSNSFDRNRTQFIK